jgi:DNA-binding PadR family transcriptional regulator
VTATKRDASARERLFGRGDFKYAILDLLRERPRHGYDIIRSFEERFGGMYAPSPGVVYPTLQMLDDQGLVSFSRVEGRRVFALTQEGQAYLAENHQLIEDVKARMGEWWTGQGGAEWNATVEQVRAIDRLVSRRARGLSPEALRAIATLLRRTRTDIQEILGE